ncbi:unnamed protein product [Anisakis simplex]|uniref:Alpha-tubulin N-acetyltransferase n=1 Tax=Anisakis simplex TaxID=6269 RepID=A0A158PPM2_ANISI|nr:unnamed protein product [Anisakis simplex]
MWSRGLRTAHLWTRRTLIGGTAAFHLAESNEKSDQKLKLEETTQHRNMGVFTRKVESDADKTLLNVRLYQYQTCPFCCKVRAVLDYYGFNYDIIEVNPITKKEIQFSPHYKKVPILVTGDKTEDAEILVESSLIVSILSTFLHRTNSSLNEIQQFYPQLDSVDPKTNKKIIQYPNKYFIMFDDKDQLHSDKQIVQKSREEREWREWIDSHFIHLISPNVYRTFQESLATFQWFSEVGRWKEAFTLWERLVAVYLGATAMFIISKRLKKRHNIDNERDALVNACNLWLSALGDRPFLGGDQPNLADLELYGAMNSFYGCQAFKEMKDRSRIGEWFERMKNAVGSRSGSALLAQRCQYVVQVDCSSQPESQYLYPNQNFSLFEMEVPYDLSEYFKESPIERLDATTLRRLNPRKCWPVQKTIDRMGALSAEVDLPSLSITSWLTSVRHNPNLFLQLTLSFYPYAFDVFRVSVFHFTVNRQSSIIIGLLKVGYKCLYLMDSAMRTFKTTPLCILDFYVHNTLQRRGNGHALFEYMLKHQKSSAEKIAIDKPSESLLQFMNKFYRLANPLWQPTNFVVYEAFFDNAKEYDKVFDNDDDDTIKHSSSSKTEALLYDEEREKTQRARRSDTVAGLMCSDTGSSSPPTVRASAAPDTPKGRKNTRDFGHQSIW